MRQSLTFIIIAICSLNSFGFPGDPGGDPDGIPVDNGISWLALAGIVFGFFKIKKVLKQKSEEQQ